MTTSLFAAVTNPGLKSLSGHVPADIRRKHLAATGNLNATNQLELAIGLPLRDKAGLDRYLADISNPGSPNYHRYLTPEQFTEQFGPTVADYQQVIDYAKNNGMAVTHAYGNRMVLDVQGSVSDIDRAFHVTLKQYQHPKEKRDFFAPDVEPSVPNNLPVADISGLNNYELPKPRSVIRTNSILPRVHPRLGSGYASGYFGSDFRNTYLPGATLTGAGQEVGLLQFDSFYASDISNYVADAGMTNVPIVTVLLDGVSGAPSTDSQQVGEVSLDIEMTMSMAPGLADIVVFEGSTAVDILDAMVSSNQVKQLSCSWGWGSIPDATMDSIFMQMAAQGQSFYSASGDSDAFTTGSNSVNGVDNPTLQASPSSSPYITQVGATTLETTNVGSGYQTESVWNWGGGVGSSGGISSSYSIPTWQQGIDFVANPEASVTQRNIPDVALTGDNVVVYYFQGSEDIFGGTSCAAPLWAGFTALVNEQETALGQPSIGFINPAIYEIANENIYDSVFHDVQTGNNTSPVSPDLFYAKPGYDLCTGLGTPNGTNLINALVSPDELIVAPNYGFGSTGTRGGAFNISTQDYWITNNSAQTMTWSLMNTSAWLQASATGGTLAAGGSTLVTLSLTASSSNLTVGVYSSGICFSNETTGIGHVRHFSLLVSDYMDAEPPGLTNNGAAGSLDPVDQFFVVSNSGPANLNWSLVNTSIWLNVTPTNGALASGDTANVMVSLTPQANALTGGFYPVTVYFRDVDSGYAQARVVVLAPSQNILLNGGFETGDFTDWTLVGDTVSGGIVYDAVVDTNALAGGAGIYCVHSGLYGAALGESGYLATLSQSIYTQPGMAYMISLWLQNHDSGSGQEFQVNWSTNSAVNNTLFDQSNPGSFDWTNMTFVVMASDTNCTLQFGAENDSAVYGLDDVSVTPIPQPTIRSFGVTNDLMTINYNSLAGVQYQVESTTDLTSGNWTIINTNTATDYLSTQTFPVGGEAEEFYRVFLITQ